MSQSPAKTAHCFWRAVVHNIDWTMVAKGEAVGHLLAGWDQTHMDASSSMILSDRSRYITALHNWCILGTLPTNAS